MSQQGDYKIACHRTVDPQGKVLDNDGAAPPALIAWHEARSDLKAPPEARTWTLAEVNLYFLSQGGIRPS